MASWNENKSAGDLIKSADYNIRTDLLTAASANALWASSNLTTHMADTDIHFASSNLRTWFDSVYAPSSDYLTQVEADALYAVTGSYLTQDSTDALYYPSSSGKSHVDDTTLHFTIDSIRDDFAPSSAYKSHTSDSTIHFTKSSIDDDYYPSSLGSIVSSSVYSHIDDSSIHTELDTLDSRFAPSGVDYLTESEADNLYSPTGALTQDLADSLYSPTGATGGISQDSADALYYPSSLGSIISSSVYTHVDDSTIHFTTDSIDGSYAPSASYHSHITDSDIHFPSSQMRGWLDGVYAPTGVSTGISQDSADSLYYPSSLGKIVSGSTYTHIADTTIHFTTDTTDSLYAPSSHTHGIYLTQDTADGIYSPTGALVQDTADNLYAPSGIISVTYLSSLSDVSFIKSGIENGQALVWNATLAKWSAQTIAGGSGGAPSSASYITINAEGGLTNETLASALAGDYITWSATSYNLASGQLKDWLDEVYSPSSHVHSYLTQDTADGLYAVSGDYLTSDEADALYSPTGHTHSYLTQDSADGLYYPSSLGSIISSSVYTHIDDSSIHTELDTLYGLFAPSGVDYLTQDEADGIYSPTGALTTTSANELYYASSLGSIVSSSVYTHIDDSTIHFTVESIDGTYAPSGDITWAYSTLDGRYYTEDESDGLFAPSGVDYLTQDEGDSLYAPSGIDYLTSDEADVLYYPSGLGSSVSSSLYTHIDDSSIHTELDTLDSRYAPSGIDFLTEDEADALYSPSGLATGLTQDQADALYSPSGSIPTYGSGIKIGTPTDGSLTDGCLSWSINTLMTDAIDDLNETLSELAPADASALAGALSMAGTTLYSGRLAGGTNYEYEDGVTSGSSVSYVIKDDNFTLATPNRSSMFNNADTGTLSVYFNGNVSGQVPLGDLFSEGERTGTQSVYPSTNGNLRVDGVSRYNAFSKWQQGSGTVVITSLNDFYTEIWVAHTGITSPVSSSKYKIWNDPLNTTVSISGTPTCVEDLFTSSKYRSGIKFYSNNDTFRCGAVVINGFDSLYRTDNRVLRYENANFPGTTDNQYIEYTHASGSGVTTPPMTGQTFTLTNWKVTIDTSYQRATNARIGFQGYSGYGSTAVSYSTTENRLVDTYTDGFRAGYEDETKETFDNEFYRLPSGAYDTVPSPYSGQYDSYKALGVISAQVWNGSLTYPQNINYTSGYLPTQQAGTNYTSLQSGDVYYYRVFRDSGTPHSNGELEFTGLVNADIVEEGTAGNVHVSIKLPTQTGWLDLGKGYNAGTFTGADGDGCRSAQSGDNWSWTAGTFSTSDSGYLIVVRVTLRNDNKSISEIEEVGW